MGRDFAADIFSGGEDADGAVIRKRGRVLCVFRMDEQKHMSLWHTLAVFMQDAGGIGNVNAHLLCGDEELEDMLAVIFGRIDIFQRHRQYRARVEPVPVKSVRICFPVF